MSFISPIATDSNGNPRATGSMQSLGKDDFLNLLVTKMRHQDPLEPMSDEDFIAQLAQFSSLEQMNNISEGIETSNQWDFLQMQSINNTMASGLIGREIQASYDGLYVEGDNSPLIAYTTNEFAKDMTFTIKDASGNIVKTLTQSDVQAGSNSINWDGTNTIGNRVPDGEYVVEVVGTSAAGGVVTPKLSLVGIVDAINYRDGSAFLSVNGSEIPLSDISGIGMPGTFSGDNDGDEE